MQPGVSRVKKKFFNHIVQLSHSFHNDHKTGSLISKLNRGTRAIEGISDFFIFNITPLILQIIIVGTSLAFIDWLSALVIFGTATVFIAYGFLISHVQKKSHTKFNEADDREKANLADVLTNIDSIKYFGKEKRIKEYAKNLSHL